MDVKWHTNAQYDRKVDKNMVADKIKKQNR